MILLVIGVAGAGKSTLGAALAGRLGWTFVEGDALHPAPNLAKMGAGVALTDADRAPWLDAIADRMAALERDGVGAVVAVSALKEGYRARLRAGAGAARVGIVALTLDPALARARVAARQATGAGHLMAPALVASQFAAWEPPTPGEGALTLDASTPLEEAVAAAAAYARGISATP